MSAGPAIGAYERGLAPYAVSSTQSRGRRFAEAEAPSRTAFQRDRDRIVHCTAFRRLEYKTQVFVNHEGDLFRTRLTHSLEVAQIARTVARSLNVNEDLVEAIALAHDLGHTPFGHAGQDALNECMHPFGGFEHNLQSLRVVDELEERYGDFDGLNLCYETREGILKHCSASDARRLGEVAERFLSHRQASVEAQIANLADEIAYNNHDVDDGLRSGLITMAQLDGIPIVARHCEEVRQRYPSIGERRLVHEMVRRMINTLVTDLLEETSRRIAEAAPRSVEDVRNSPPMVGFSESILGQAKSLKLFLRDMLYRHSEVMRMTSKSRRVIRELFDAFRQEPRLLPPDYQARVTRDGPRAIADYIAGMTDRYAIREYRRLFAVEERA
jgi:dGTPase